MSNFYLCVLGQYVRVSVSDASVGALLSSCYSAFVAREANPPDVSLDYEIDADPAAATWCIADDEHETSGEGLASLLYSLEKSLTIELQHLRPDLYFLHAAVLERNDRCVLIIGASGSGKSTLCWELCNIGFGYMSDELAPVELESFMVHAYPRAICIKKTFDRMTSLPAQTIDAGATLHIPAQALPAQTVHAPKRLDAILFLDDPSADNAGAAERIGKAQAAARIYANSLNALAHAKDGLTGAARIAAENEAWMVSRAAPQEMIHNIRTALGSSRF